MCEKNATWDAEVYKRGIHILVCDDHRKEAAIELCRRGELILRPLTSSEAGTSAYLRDQEATNAEA